MKAEIKQQTEQVTEVTDKNNQSVTKPSVNFEYKLYNLFNAIKHLGNVNIKATEKGLEIWGTDLSNTILTQVFIDKKDIRNYEYKEPIEITTDTEYLKIVKRLYMVKAYIDEKMMIFEEDRTKIKMPVFDKESKEIPNLDLKKAVSFEISSINIRKALKDIEAIGDESFEMEFKDKNIILSASGKYGTLTKTLEPYEKGIKKFEKKVDSIRVCLSVELFRNALNGMSDKIRITIGENSPIIVENVEEEYSRLTEKVTHYLAPRYSGSDYDESDESEDIDTENPDDKESYEEPIEA